LIDEIKQNTFWKLIFFVSSVTFCGFFVSLPASVAIIAMIHLNCQAHSMARRRLGHNCLGVCHLPIFGAMSMHKGFVLHEKEKFLVAISGPLAGLICTLLFCLYSALLSPIEFGEIAKILIILNLANLLPIALMDGTQICKSIGFSNSAFSGYVFLTTGIVASCFLCNYHFVFIFFFLLCVWELKATVFHKSDTRRMNRTEQFMAIMAYSSIIAIFIALYLYVNEFNGSGAMTAFMLSE
jgi:Zn-dependent protease